MSTDRPEGVNGPRPIPKASIDRHIQGWPESEADIFRYAIREMDNAYLKHHSKEPDIPETDNPARDAFRAAMR